MIKITLINVLRNNMKTDIIKEMQDISEKISKVRVECQNKITESFIKNHFDKEDEKIIQSRKETILYLSPISI